jgi:hypothetical protein
LFLRKEGGTKWEELKPCVPQPNDGRELKEGVCGLRHTGSITNKKIGIKIKSGLGIQILLFFHEIIAESSFPLETRSKLKWKDTTKTKEVLSNERKHRSRAIYFFWVFGLKPLC